MFLQLILLFALVHSSNGWVSASLFGKPSATSATTGTTTGTALGSVAVRSPSSVLTNDGENHNHNDHANHHHNHHHHRHHDNNRRRQQQQRFQQQAMDRYVKEIDAETYRTNLRIAALARQCATTKNVTAAVHSIRLLRSLSHPDSVAYNSVLKTLAKISPARINLAELSPNAHLLHGENDADSSSSSSSWTDAAHIAHELWQEMQDLHNRQVAANQEWYQDLAAGRLSDLELERGAPRVRVKANCRTVSTVMDAWSRNGDVESAQRCQQLLRHLQDEFQATGDVALQPNLITYNTLLWAHAKCGGRAAEQACLDIVRSMPMTPDVISHNAILHVLARSGRQDAGERAEAYLRDVLLVPQSPQQQQPQRHHDGTPTSGVNRLPPLANGRSYSTCMDAWSQVGRPERAHALLQEMLELHERHGEDASLAPNVITYSTIVHAYARSSLPDKAVRAQALVADMLRRGIPTNTVITNALLNACASTTPPTRQVIAMCQGVYKAVVAANQADHFTFGTVLKACSNFFPPANTDDNGFFADDPQSSSSSSSSHAFALSVFQEACKSGQVSEGVLKQLYFAIPNSVYQKMVGNRYTLPRGEIPYEWRRNVRDSPLSSRRRQLRNGNNNR